MKFSFIAKHRGIWPVAWLCEARGVEQRHNRDTDLVMIPVEGAHRSGMKWPGIPA